MTKRLTKYVKQIVKTDLIENNLHNKINVKLGSRLETPVGNHTYILFPLHRCTYDPYNVISQLISRHIDR